MYTYFKAKVSANTRAVAKRDSDPAQWTFISFLFLFAIGSLVCGAANSSNMLIAGRALAGMGTSGLQNGAMTIIVNSVAMPKRPGRSWTRRGERASAESIC